MKPNEITEREIAKWSRSEAGDQGGSAAPEPCDAIDRAEAWQLFETLAAKARLADLGEQSSTLAHELRQPLFSIAMANENLRMMLAMSNAMQPQFAMALERIGEQVQRAQSIIEHTLAYASGNSLGTVSSDLGRSIDNAVRFLRPLFTENGIEIDHGEAKLHAEVALCQVEVEQVFVNILRNAVESIGARIDAGWRGVGRIVIQTVIEGNRVRCQILDNGSGLSSDATKSVFEPFFTTKPRIGTGLGLHICRQAVGRIGGRISLSPGAEEGACVDLELPLLAR